MTHVPAEELESLALDELPRDRAAQVEAHAAACPQCARELSWLRAEQTLLARRPPAQTAHLWAAIAARLRHPRRATRQQRERPAIDPKALAALDRAEADYKDAAKVLEAEYARLRPRLDPEMARRWDETLTRARAQLGESRAVAADDVNVRMRVLDGYAGYLRSLRDVVQDSEEAIP
ncbi:MAG: hypothetical protein E6J86_01775 [Deltaproteobacteria bacterium]|nr:MAG: hypothetical protein E6J86_01775 [Deltaproteobacteria bacterium]